MRVVVDYVLANFDSLFEKVWHDDKRDAASCIVDLIVEELSSPRFARRGSLGDYACTVIFAAADDDRMLLGHLGDGIALSVNAQSAEIASLPDNGEFANETYFFTAADAVERFRITATKLEAPVSIVLASDGTAVSLLRRSDLVVAPAAARLCEWAASRPRKVMNGALRANLEGIFREKTMDDCSISIMADPRAHASPGTGASQ